LGTIFREIRATAETAQLEYDAMSYMTLELTRYMAIHDTIQLLELGLVDLMHGQLTLRLIDVGEMAKILQNVSQVLYQAGFELCQKTPRDVYIASNFDVVRRDQDLYVQLRLPYAKLGQAHVNVYKTYTFAIPVPGSQGLTTKVKDIPTLLLGEPNSVRIEELSEEPRYPALEAKRVKWHAHHQQTCIWALVADRMDVVIQNCDFSAKKDNIDPKYV
jgi:hypothetical protein